MAKKSETSEQPKVLRITQVRSLSGRPEKHRKTIRALGLKRHQQSVIQKDNAAIRGMLFQVQHLVRVEEIAEGEA